MVEGPAIFQTLSRETAYCLARGHPPPVSGNSILDTNTATETWKGIFCTKKILTCIITLSYLKFVSSKVEIRDNIDWSNTFIFHTKINVFFQHKIYVKITSSKNARDAFTVIMDKKVFRTQCFLDVQSLARLHKLRIIFYHKSFTGKSWMNGGGGSYLTVKLVF